MKFEYIRESKAREVVNLLELFKSQLSLTDILDTSLVLLTQLRDAKLAILKEEYEKKQKDENKDVINTTLTSPEAIRNRINPSRKRKVK